MAIVAIRGTSFSQYLKPGYNVVRRYQRGVQPDNDYDCFEWLCSAKTLKLAETKARKYKGQIEIREFKIQEPENGK